MRISILTTLLIYFFPSNAQRINTKINDFAKQNSVDTFLVYSFESSGYGLFTDTCSFEQSHYLLWRKSDSSFLKRFDYCTTYQTILLDNSNPLSFYLENKTQIDTEDIKLPTYYETKKTKKGNEILTVTTTGVSHSSYHKFTFTQPELSTDKYANVYYLNFECFDDRSRNVHYDENNRTKFKSLIDMTKTLIDRLKGENKFERE